MAQRVRTGDYGQTSFDYTPEFQLLNDNVARICTNTKVMYDAQQEYNTFTLNAIRDCTFELSQKLEENNQLLRELITLLNRDVSPSKENDDITSKPSGNAEEDLSEGKDKENIEDDKSALKGGREDILNDPRNPFKDHPFIHIA